jgi:hypothetical protein
MSRTASVQTSAEGDEHDHLGERRERRVEALDLALVREPRVPEDQPGDEHGEEAGPVRERPRAVQRAGEREREDGIEALAREAQAAEGGEEEQAAGDPGRGPDPHLDHELAHDHEPRGVVVRRQLDHAEHERDAGRVVHARLALERGPRAAGDLPPPEHREHHGGVGRRQRRSDEPREHPAEPERVVREGRDDARGREGAENPEREDLAAGSPEAAPADLHPPVEEDHDQRHDRDALDREDRDAVVDLRPEVGDGGGGEQEDPGRRHGEPGRERGGEDRERERSGHDEKDAREVCDLGHG